MLVTEVTVWHGTQEELYEFQRAIAHNCACDQEAGFTCTAHRLPTDQRVCDGLLFARHIVARLQKEEFVR